MNTVIQSIFESLDWPEKEEKVLQALLSTVDSQRKIRYLAAILPIKFRKDLYGHTEQAIREAWGNPSPFGHVPMKDGLILYASVAKQCYPELPFWERTNQLMKDVIISQKDHFFIRAFVKATDLNWRTFIESLPRMRTFHALPHQKDQISIWLEWKGKREVELYERTPTAYAACYLLSGAFRGFMEIFGKRGEVRGKLIHDKLCKLHVQWDA